MESENTVTIPLDEYFDLDDEQNHCIDDAVTHWMPLPEPPKGE